MYREIQRIRDTMDSVQNALQSAILADDTRVISRYATEAQMKADQILRAIEDAKENRGSLENMGEGRVERSFVEAAMGALSKAVTDGERVAAGASASEMRERLIGFKTHVDFAHAYLYAALGGQIE